MAALDRFDSQSDGAILEKTLKSVSPANPAHLRLTATLPWGEVLEADVDEWGLNAATAWCGMVRSTIDERYDSENLTSVRNTSGPEVDGVGSGGVDEGGGEESVQAPVQAPQERVAEDESPAATLRRSLLRSEEKLESLEGDCLAAEQKTRVLYEEAATVTKTITALRAALEVLDDGLQNDEAPSASVSGADA